MILHHGMGHRGILTQSRIRDDVLTDVVAVGWTGPEKKPEMQSCQTSIGGRLRCAGAWGDARFEGIIRSEKPLFWQFSSMHTYLAAIQLQPKH